METIVCLQKKEEVHSQAIGDNYSLVIPGFSGSGNDLRIILTPEAQAELVADIARVKEAHRIHTESKTN